MFTTYPAHGRYFRTAPSSSLEGDALGNLVAGDGNRTFVLLSRDDEFGNSLRQETDGGRCTSFADCMKLVNDPARHGR